MPGYKPRKGQQYWMINSRFDVKHTEYTGSAKSKARIAAGNCFKTQAEAERFRDVVIEGSLIEIEKVGFDKSIAFLYGLMTGLSIAVLIWQAVRQ